MPGPDTITRKIDPSKVKIIGEKTETNQPGTKELERKIDPEKIVIGSKKNE